MNAEFPCKRASMAPGPVSVLANLLPLQVPSVLVHHYSLSFDPEVKPSLLFSYWQRIVNENKELQHFVFDASSALYSLKKIANIQFVLKCGRSELNCTIAYKNVLDFKKLKTFLDLKSSVCVTDFTQHLACLDAFLRYHQRMTFYTSGRNVFGPSQSFSLPGGVELMLGLCYNVKLTSAGLFLNLDMQPGVFLPNVPILQLLAQLNQRNDPRGGGSRGGPRDNPRGPGTYNRRDGPGKDGNRNGKDNRDGRFVKDGRDSRDRIPRDASRPTRRAIGTDQIQSNNAPGICNGEYQPGLNLQSLNIEHYLPDIHDNSPDLIYTDDHHPFDESNNFEEDLHLQIHGRRVLRTGGQYNDRNRNQGGDNTRNRNDNRRGDNNRGPNDFNPADINQEDCRVLCTLLKGVRITTTHLPQNYSFTFDGLSDQPASAIFFETEEGKLSVADYFAQRYTPLKYPNLPCAVRRRKDRDDSFFPLEILRIKDTQQSRRKLTEDQTAAVVRHAALKPADRFPLALSTAEKAQLFDNTTLQSANIKLSKVFVTTRARQLQPPKLQYGKDKQGGGVITPRNGGWNLIGLQAITPVSIKSWAVGFLPGAGLSVGSLRSQFETLVSAAKAFGIQMPPPSEIFQIESPMAYSAYIKKTKHTFLIIILNKKTFEPYKEIKWRSEADAQSTGTPCVVTQCMISKNVRKLTDKSFCANLLLKINIKLQGRNWVLQDRILRKPTMLFGADVTHPGIGDLTSPSIVAVTGSLDEDTTKYSTTIKIQERRIEMIQDFGEIIKQKILRFQKEKKVLPKSIIVFRDGIGESQFMETFKTEIQSIKDALNSLTKTNQTNQTEITLTFIIVQKRHQVKFAQKGSMSNIEPGTVCDQIGNINTNDFYLVAHQAFQGTAKPVRYQILYNEDKTLSTEQIQQMSNKLCYIFPRATKSVSVCAPVYFAHLAAARARCYLEENDIKKVHESLTNHLYFI